MNSTGNNSTIFTNEQRAQLKSINKTEIKKNNSLTKIFLQGKSKSKSKDSRQESASKKTAK